MRCQTFSFSFFPCSADHERDWPPCKVVFFGLATNALNVRKQQQKTTTISVVCLNASNMNPTSYFFLHKREIVDYVILPLICMVITYVSYTYVYMYVYMIITYSKSKDQPGEIANPARVVS